MKQPGSACRGMTSQSRATSFQQGIGSSRGRQLRKLNWRRVLLLSSGADNIYRSGACQRAASAAAREGIVVIVEPPMPPIMAGDARASMATLDRYSMR